MQATFEHIPQPAAHRLKQISFIEGDISFSHRIQLRSKQVELSAKSKELFGQRGSVSARRNHCISAHLEEDRQIASARPSFQQNQERSLMSSAQKTVALRELQIDRNELFRRTRAQSFLEKPISMHSKRVLLVVIKDAHRFLGCLKQSKLFYEPLEITARGTRTTIGATNRKVLCGKIEESLVRNLAGSTMPCLKLSTIRIGKDDKVIRKSTLDKTTIGKFNSFDEPIIGKLSTVEVGSTTIQRLDGCLEKKQIINTCFETTERLLEHISKSQMSQYKLLYDNSLREISSFAEINIKKEETDMSILIASPIDLHSISLADVFEMDQNENVKNRWLISAEGKLNNRRVLGGDCDTSQANKQPECKYQTQGQNEASRYNQQQQQFQQKLSYEQYQLLQSSTIRNQQEFMHQLQLSTQYQTLKQQQMKLDIPFEKGLKKIDLRVSKENKAPFAIKQTKQKQNVRTKDISFQKAPKGNENTFVPYSKQNWQQWSESGSEDSGESQFEEGSKDQLKSLEKKSISLDSQRNTNNRTAMLGNSRYSNEILQEKIIQDYSVELEAQLPAKNDLKSQLNGNDQFKRSLNNFMNEHPTTKIIYGLRGFVKKKQMKLIGEGDREDINSINSSSNNSNSLARLLVDKAELGSYKSLCEVLWRESFWCYSQQELDELLQVFLRLVGKQLLDKVSEALAGIERYNTQGRIEYLFNEYLKVSPNAMSEEFIAAKRLKQLKVLNSALGYFKERQINGQDGRTQEGIDDNGLIWREFVKLKAQLVDNKWSREQRVDFVLQILNPKNEQMVPVGQIQKLLPKRIRGADSRQMTLLKQFICAPNHVHNQKISFARISDCLSKEIYVRISDVLAYFLTEQ